MSTALPAPQSRVICIGECMVELARGSDGRYGLAYGGDTFNTAVYLARCGISTAYATLLGDDPYSAGVLALARAENVGTDLAGVVPGRSAGLYLIETSAAGERSFYYWRERAPARELFNGDAAFGVAAAMNSARLIYLSGITLSLYDARGLDVLEAALVAAKSCGAQVAIDSNYRPRGWSGTEGLARARNTFERFFRRADIALPTFDDEQALWGDATPEAAIARMRAWGITEIALKCGGEGAVVDNDGTRTQVPVPAPVVAVDTTAAGDSFNAAYLAARLQGAAPTVAAAAGHALAAVVIQHRGAIVPKMATDAVVRRGWQ